jgi:hypothetical protein
MIAAAIIMVVVAGGFFVLPKLMLALGGISPWLAFAVAVIFVGGFFVVFWLRGRYRRRGE